MAFEAGSLSVRMFYVPAGLPEDALTRFARDAAPPLGSLGADELSGWVGGRHLLDLPIDEENALLGGTWRLSLMQAVRKIPASLFKAECMIEEMAHRRALGREELPRKVKSEIRRQIQERLLPQMPPTLRGIPFIFDPSGDMLYAAALSDKQLDAFRINFTRTTGVEAIPAGPETVAARRARVDTGEWFKTSFSPAVPDAEVIDQAGLDFLTWLWFVTEARGGILKDPDIGQFALMLEGPLLFAMEGAGAHETVVRKGEPMISTEAKACLLAGKKLRRARLTLAAGEEVWKATLDAETFVFRGLKMPDPEEGLDPVSRFQDRVRKIDLFRDMFFALYDRFVAERRDEAVWRDTVREMHRWVTERKTRN